MANKFLSVNLYKRGNKNFIDKFIKWALTIGRVVIIVTELIALSAFLYRFSLDRELVDLHEKIKANQNIVNLLKKDEDKYRNLQDRLLIAERFSKKGTDLYATYQELLSLVPNEFELNSITLTEKSFSIQGNVRSITSIATLIRSFRENPKISSISIDQIENKTSSGIITTGVSAMLKNTEQPL